MGPPKAKKDIENDIMHSPLTLCGQTMPVSANEKYLGDVIDSKGLKESVHATILRRKGQTIKSIIEVRAVVDDFRANTTGGIITGTEIWELSIIPFLLYNCETWTDIGKNSILLLDSLQYMFVRYLLATPKTCPTPALLWETGFMLMEHRIAIRKLTFYHHLMNLPQGSLAYQIATTQIRFSFPGLMKECEDLLLKYSLPNNPTELSKQRWKSLVKRSAGDKNQQDILNQVKKLKKIDYEKLKNEKYEMKSYLKDMNIADARLKFAIRSKMTKSVMMNFKGVSEYEKKGWKCDTCGELDTQEHITMCPAFKELRADKVLNNDKDIVEYFRQVIQIRESLVS